VLAGARSSSCRQPGWRWRRAALGAEKTGYGYSMRRRRRIIGALAFLVPFVVSVFLIPWMRVRSEGACIGCALMPLPALRLAA
jgi:hypothetical protein